MKKVVSINHKRKGSKRKFLSQLKVALILLIVLDIIFSFARGYYRTFKKNQEVVQTKSLLESLKRENTALRKKIEMLKTDEEAERLAREMGLVKPNELSFRMVSPQNRRQRSEVRRGKGEGRSHR